MNARRTVRVAGVDVPADEFFSLCDAGREVAKVVGLDKAREIIRVALGRSGNAKAGTGSLYIPKTADAAGHLSDLIGRAAALALIAAMPCAILNFSNGKDLRRRRDAQVAAMLRRGLDAERVAELFGMTRKQVQNIAASQRVDLVAKRPRPTARVLLARGRKVVARRIAAAGLPAHALRRSAACPLYRRALAEVAARHGLEVPEGSAEVGGGTAGKA